MTAASHSDARQVGRQNPVKSRGNRVQTRALLDSHVDINDLSDYACTLAIHMTNIILTTCIDEERYASGPHRLRQSARPPGPRARPIRASQQPPTTPGASSRARGRQGAAQRHKVRAQRSRKSARTGQVRGRAARLPAFLASLDSQRTKRLLEINQEAVETAVPGATRRPARLYKV